MTKLPAGLPDDLPRDFPLWERNAVRLVVRDSEDRVLLFHTHAIAAPELGRWWGLPGGGIDEGETWWQAALRELAEEAGLLVPPERLGRPLWRRTASFCHRQRRHLQHEVIAEVRLEGPGPDIDDSGRYDYEKEDYFDFRWWPVAEVVASRERFYPGRLPLLLPRLLAGEEVNEPFELFS
jgi:8-oxo-dGTP pyrophosphatase MutT (NUDIX family)